MSVQLTRHRFTWDDYHAMAAAGALKEDDRVELIEGEIVDMTPIGSRHAAVVDRLTRWLVMGCGSPRVPRTASFACGIWIEAVRPASFPLIR